MKVLMFGWEFPPFNSGGLGVACFGLTKALAKSGTEIVFVLPKQVDVDASHLKVVFAGIKNSKLISVDSPLSPYQTQKTYYCEVLGKKIPLYGQSLMEEVVRYAQLAKDIAMTEQYDVIHAHDWLSFLAGIEAKKISGKPLVVHVHATEYDRSGEKGLYREVFEIEKKGMEEADKIVAVSQYTKDLIAEKYHVNPEKIEVAHNGIDLGEYKSEDKLQVLQELKNKGFKIVLFVGRITFQKGPDNFIKAAQKVLAYRPKTIFIMAGSGDMETQIYHQTAALGISDKVIFTGFLRGKDLNAVYKNADLYVFPSISEPFGITPLESIANGTPVLMSKQSGVSEVITHALKVDFWDVDDMVDKIVAVLDHDSLKKELTVNSSKEVKDMNWDKAAAVCMSVYDGVCQKLLN